MADLVEVPAKPLRELAEPYLNEWGPYSITRDAVTETAIRRFCEVAEDGNPVYWDREFAEKSRFGRVIAPPQSLFSMTFAAWWTPEFLKQKTTGDAAALNPAGTALGGNKVYALCDEYGYTVNTVAGQEVEYIAPFGPGDGRLKLRSMTTEVSDEKKVRVGRGVFVTSVTEYRTEIGDRLVGRSTMVLLRYKAEGSDDG
ncbi:MAG: MaoC family dehydratase [Pseudomonadales bacterium]|jgi:acyl dehydratase|nr:MaoC family dehydratase [Pseudomonadales bacterium]MDP7357006.1 MaoC family dehydratase [Pseudomonadales bacterium]MDP7596060.1 MaoC family dehydratase [Pseudomonadales bacterium]HJN50549.1 MaoC family dehydratase [Pseudomonadales bacterium]|tara:strand:- start:303 stop:899 length:597 start_codon:yes stop_codon:yes gene_type:complete